MHELLGHGRPARDADRLDAVEPLLPDLARVVDAVGGLGAVLERDLDEPHAVRAVRRADDDHEVGVLRDLLDRDLAVLGGVADVVAGRILQLAGTARAVDARSPWSRRPRGSSARARPPCRGRAPRCVGTSSGLPTRVTCVGRLARRALDLFVALVADEQDLEVVAREADGLAVHLGHQRAGRVDGVQAAVGGGVARPPARRRAR